MSIYLLCLASCQLRHLVVCNSLHCTAHITCTSCCCLHPVFAFCAAATKTGRAPTARCLHRHACFETRLCCGWGASAASKAWGQSPHYPVILLCIIYQHIRAEASLHPGGLTCSHVMYAKARYLICHRAPACIQLQHACMHVRCQHPWLLLLLLSPVAATIGHAGPTCWSSRQFTPYLAVGWGFGGPSRSRPSTL